MLKNLGILVVVVILLAIAYPFAQDAYHRWQVNQRLSAVMDSKERMEFQNWKGSATSFARTLYDRCQLSQGQGAVQCDRYRSAFE